MVCRLGMRLLTPADRPIAREKGIITEVQGVKDHHRIARG